MTSVLRRYSQIEPRIKYFTVLTDTSGYTLNGGSISNPLMDASSYVAAYTDTVTFLSGVQLLDLGRSITVYNPTVTGSPHVGLFRQVMLVNGPNIEGTNSTIAYICTWADGSGLFEPAAVARTG